MLLFVSSLLGVPSILKISDFIDHVVSICHCVCNVHAQAVGCDWSHGIHTNPVTWCCVQPHSRVKKKVTLNVYLYTRHQTIQGNSLMQITGFTYIWGYMRLIAVSRIGLTGFKSPLGDVWERELNA